RFAKKFGKRIDAVSRDTMDRLVAYGWPGNIRELQNVIERAAIVSRGGPLRLGAVLPERSAGTPAPAAPAPEVLGEAAMKERMRQNLETALRESGGRIYGAGGAAARLGIKPTTLASRLKSLGIRRRPAPWTR
ncbi:MAG TPA: hypothetical protein VLF95_02135, partial [Vicinamibacteria bacterium]|nr:hypothetical protein [Vicinamibacteria bacterium]